MGADARELLGRLPVGFSGSALPAQAEVLRQILVQHFLVDGRAGSGRARARWPAAVAGADRVAA
ncbi:hypothetical protein [Streptomyces caniferus]|uniref:hypothetical protein n=1 Tax=Streptomyces caniferus TaxID=285557 RepID=UPI003811BD00